MVGFFDFLTGGKKNQDPATSTQSHSKINLRKEKVRISLEKNNIVTEKARVCLVIDVSGSIQQLYHRGVIQDAVEKLFAVAMNLDDNGEMEVWIFDDKFHRLPSVTEANYHGYIEKEVLNTSIRMWNSTRYAPVMRDVAKKFIDEDPDTTPVFAMFITDGENDRDDKKTAIETITELSYQPIFWQFVGVGKQSFKFLSQLDTMEGRFIDNANFFQLDDLNKITDEELYDRLLNEFPTWLREAKIKHIID